jgi:hypothetical protein
MTIPNTNVSLQDFNGNLRRSLANTISFSSGFVGAFNDDPTSNVSFGGARSRLSFPLSAPPGWAYVFDFAFSSALTDDYCKTMTVLSGSPAGTIVSGSLDLSGLTRERNYILKTPTPTNVNLSNYSGNWTFNLIINVSSDTPSISRFVTLNSAVSNSSSSIRYNDSDLEFFCFDTNNNLTTIKGGSRIVNTQMTVTVRRTSNTNITLLQNGSTIGSATIASNSAFNFSTVRLGEAGGETFKGSIREFSLHRSGVG